MHSQHHISAMQKMNSGNGVMVNCKVYSGLTYEQEAASCYRLDKAKKRLSLSQSANALRKPLRSGSLWKTAGSYGRWARAKGCGEPAEREYGRPEGGGITGGEICEAVGITFYVEEKSITIDCRKC